MYVPLQLGISTKLGLRNANLEFQVCEANLGLSNNLRKLWISNFEQINGRIYM